MIRSTGNLNERLVSTMPSKVRSMQSRARTAQNLVGNIETKHAERSQLRGKAYTTRLGGPPKGHAEVLWKTDTNPDFGQKQPSAQLRSPRVPPGGRVKLGGMVARGLGLRQQRTSQCDRMAAHLVDDQTHQTSLALNPVSTKNAADSRVQTSSEHSSRDIRRPHPPSFYCPISHQCMHDPVVLTDGHTYERRHIEKWLKDNTTSPVSGAQLPHTTIFPNHALRNAIEEYFEQVLDGHRQAIRQAMNGLRHHGGPDSNGTLLKTLDSLMHCSILVNADLSVERVLERIMAEAKSLVGAEAASVFLVDRRSKELYSTVNSTGAELRIPLRSGVAGFVAYSGGPVIINDAYMDSRFNTAVDSRTGFKTRNILCVPMRAGQGGIIGVAQLINKTDSGVLSLSPGSAGRRDRKPISCNDCGFTIDDQQFFQVLASQAGTAIVNSGLFGCIPGVSGGGHWPCMSPRESRGSTASSSDGNGLVEDTFVEYSSECKGLVHDTERAEDRGVSASSGDDEGAEDFGAVQTPKSEGMPLHMELSLMHLLDAAVYNWELDVLALAELTGNRPLSTLAAYLFDKGGLVTYFGLDRQKLDRFLSKIERGYPDCNQYHNRAHAASVSHFMHLLLSLGGVAEAACVVAADVGEDTERQTRIVQLAGILAAVVHDFEHTGFNNEFLVKASREQARRYNDRSPNENHHVAAAMKVLQQPECNFLENFTPAEFRIVRSIVIDLVLGTDMAQDGHILKAFKEAACTGKKGPDGRFSPQSPKAAVLALQVALKCADLGHLSLGWSSHLRWVQRLEREFFAQGDEEKLLGFPQVSSLMDRNKPGVSQSQVGFFDFVVLPLFRALGGAFPSASPMLKGVEANYCLWKDTHSAIEARRA